MPKTAYISFRTDQELKEKAEEIYAAFGLGLGDAFNMFLRQSVLVGGYPFEMRLPGYFEEDTAAEVSKKTSREILAPEIVEETEDEEEEMFSEMDEENDDDDYEGYEVLDPSDPAAKAIFDKLRERGRITESSKNVTVRKRGNMVVTEEDLGVVRSSSQPAKNGEAPKAESAAQPVKKVGRNDPCPCGSGKKYKKCHGR